MQVGVNLMCLFGRSNLIDIANVGRIEEDVLRVWCSTNCILTMLFSWNAGYDARLCNAMELLKTRFNILNRCVKNGLRFTGKLLLLSGLVMQSHT
jgi:hypothetical protein